MNSSPDNPIRVLYLSHATADVYDLIREAAGGDFEMLFLDADDDDARCEKIATCQAVICAATPLTRRHLDAAQSLRIVHHQGVGWQDTTDWREIRRRNLPLALTQSGTSIGVAEHTILLMLAAAKRVSFVDAELRVGRWHINSQRAVSRELFGKTIGYIGMGRIAQAVAERLRCFGCDGVYTDSAVRLAANREHELGVYAASFDQVLARADVLSLHVPLTDSTRNIIDASALARLKKGAIVINTARGGLINEFALAEALTRGHVLAAGLDVLSVEPPPRDHPLLALPNVVLTPHISAGTQDAMRQKMSALFDNLRRFFSSGELDNRVEFP